MTLEISHVFMNPCSLKSSTCVDFLTIAEIVASTALLPLVTIVECQISPKGIQRAQRPPTNRVAELTSEPSQHSKSIGMLDKI